MEWRGGVVDDQRDSEKKKKRDQQSFAHLGGKTNTTYSAFTYSQSVCAAPPTLFACLAGYQDLSATELCHLLYHLLSHSFTVLTTPCAYMLVLVLRYNPDVGEDRCAPTWRAWPVLERTCYRARFSRAILITPAMTSC